MHNTTNVLNELPKSIQGKAKAGLHAIWIAETKAQAEQAFDRLVRDFGAKYPKAVGKRVKDRVASAGRSRPTHLCWVAGFTGVV